MDFTLSPPQDGWIIIDKPLNMTSNQVLGRLKYVYRQYFDAKPPKIGFSGTLDPLATGVLPIAMGQALKTMHYMTLSQKEYTFTVMFGTATTTYDVAGEIVATSDVRPTHDAILNIIPQFVGCVTQVPPAYSALKINGTRAYALARQGLDITMTARDIIVHSLQMTAHTHESATFHVVCSAGTYVRSLGRDIAHALGTVGHITFLRRTRVGCFDLSHAMTLDAMEKNLYTHGVLHTYPTGIGLDDILAVPITQGMYTTLMQGRLVESALELNEGSVVALWIGSVFAGFAEVDGGFLKPKRMMNI